MLQFDLQFYEELLRSELSNLSAERFFWPTGQLVVNNKRGRKSKIVTFIENQHFNSAKPR